MSFTIEDANALLPRLRPLLESLRDAHAVMEERHEQVMQSVEGNGGGDAGNSFLAATEEAERCARSITDLGVVLRDPSTGLIDFPSVRDGEEIFLCWRLGEDDIAWWHPTTSGFADRRPL
ncbi:MAG: DUF2203 domain-containing protein [Actinomycetota bacterium]